MKKRLKSWHPLAYRRERLRRYAVRFGLLMVAVLTALQVHRSDAWLYGGERDGSDPVALVVLVLCVTLALYLTRAIY